MPIIRPWIALLCLFACGQVELAPSSELKKRDYEDFEDECFETVLAIAKEENTEVTEEEILEICSSTDKRDEMRKAIKRNLISKKDVDEDICRESVVETAKELNIELTTEQITAYCSSEELIDEDTRDEKLAAIKRSLMSKKDNDENEGDNDDDGDSDDDFDCASFVLALAEAENVELTSVEADDICKSDDDFEDEDEKRAAIKRSLMSKKDNDENEGDNDDDGDSDDDFDCASFVLALAEAENVELTSVEADDICKSDDDFEDEDEKREAIKRSLLSKKDEVDDACRSFALAIAKQYNVELDEDDLFEICSEVASFEDVEKRNAVERKVLSRRGNNLSSLHETIKRSLDQFLPLVKRGLQALRRR